MCAVASTVAKLAQASESEDLAFRDFLKETCGRAVSAYEPRSGRASLQEGWGDGARGGWGTRGWAAGGEAGLGEGALGGPSVAAKVVSARPL